MVFLEDGKKLTSLQLSKEKPGNSYDTWSVICLRDCGEMNNMPSLMFMKPLEMLLTADTWEKKRQVLEEHQDLLLSKDAIDFLEAMNQYPPGPARGQGDGEWMLQTAYLMRYRELLANARIKGVRQAWAEFKMYVSALQS